MNKRQKILGAILIAFLLVGCQAADINSGFSENQGATPAVGLAMEPEGGSIVVGNPPDALAIPILSVEVEDVAPIAERPEDPGQGTTTPSKRVNPPPPSTSLRRGEVRVGRLETRRLMERDIERMIPPSAVVHFRWSVPDGAEVVGYTLQKKLSDWASFAELPPDVTTYSQDVLGAIRISYRVIARYEDGEAASESVEVTISPSRD